MAAANAPRTGAVLATLAGIIFLRVAGVSFVLSGFVAFGQSLGGSILTSGLAFAAYPLALAAMLFPLSLLSDRVGRRAVLIGGLLVSIVGAFVAAAAPSVMLLAVGRALQGGGAVNGVALATAGEIGPPERRARRMAVLGSAAGGGFAVGLIIGAVLTPYLGIRGLLVLHGVLSLFLLPAVLKTIPGGRPDAPATGLGLRETPAAVWWLSLGGFAINLSLMGLLFLSPLLLKGQSLPYALLLTIMVLPAGAGIFITSRFADMGYEGRVGIFAGILLGVAPLAFVAGGSIGVVLLLASGIVYFIGHSALTALLPAMVSARAPEGRRGAAQGIQSTLQYFGSAVGSATAAAIYPFAVGLAALFLVAGGLVLLAVAVAAGRRG